MQSNDYTQKKLIEVFNYCLKFQKSVIQDSIKNEKDEITIRNLKNSQENIDRIKDGISIGLCFGYSVIYGNIGPNFTHINKFIIDNYNKSKEDKDHYEKWLLSEYEDQKMLEALFGGINEKKKITNLDLILSFIESIFVAQNVSVLKQSSKVNYFINQLSFISDKSNIHNEFISSKGEILDLKKCISIPYIMDKSIEGQVIELLNKNTEILKKCKIICSSDEHSIVFQCNDKGQFGILDPNDINGEIKFYDTLDEAIKEIKRIHKTSFIFDISYYASKKMNFDANELDDLGKKYIQIIFDLENEIDPLKKFSSNQDKSTILYLLAKDYPSLLVKFLKINPLNITNILCNKLCNKNNNGFIVLNVLAVYNPDEFLEALKTIEANDRGQLISFSDDQKLTALHITAENHPDKLTQMLETIPEADRAQCMSVKDSRGRNSFHIIAENHPDKLTQMLETIPEADRAQCMSVKDSRGRNSFHIIAENHPDKLLQALKKIPEGDRAKCVSIKDSQGFTILHLVAIYSDCRVIQILEMVQKDKRIECMLVENNEGWTLLHMLAYKNPKKLVQLLEDASEDERVKYMLAKGPGDFTILHILAQYHQDVLPLILNLLPKDLDNKLSETIFSTRNKDGYTVFEMLIINTPDKFEKICDQMSQDHQKYARDNANLLSYVSKAVTNSLNLINDFAENINKKPLLKMAFIRDICTELDVENINAMKSIIYTPQMLLLFSITREDENMRNIVKAELQKGNHNAVVIKLSEEYARDLRKYYSQNADDHNQTFSQWRIAEKNKRSRYAFVTKCAIVGLTVCGAALLVNNAITNNR